MSHRIAVKRDAIKRPRIAAALGLLTAVAIAGALAVAAWPTHHAAPATSAGQKDVLGRPEPAGTLRLLVFLTTQPDTAAGLSRSQAVEVVSLINQYGPKGLSAKIVDESGANQKSLINTYYDWRLGDIRLVADPGRALASSFGVVTAPTTLLIDRSGSVVARWDSYSQTAQAAQAISGRLS